MTKLFPLPPGSLATRAGPANPRFGCFLSPHVLASILPSMRPTSRERQPPHRCSRHDLFVFSILPILLLKSVAAPSDLLRLPVGGYCPLNTHAVSDRRGLLKCGSFRLWRDCHGESSF